MDDDGCGCIIGIIVVVVLFSLAGSVLEFFAQNMDILFGLIFVVAALVAVGSVIATRNKLVPLQEGVHDARANVISSLQKRIDVVTRLLTIAIRYEDHERQMHKAASDATIRVAQSLTRASQQGQGFGILLSGLGTTYPSLRANETYQQLMRDLMTIESELQRHFELHNSRAAAFNSARRQFPAALFGSLAGSFDAAKYLDASMTAALLPYKFDDILPLPMNDIITAQIPLPKPPPKFGRKPPNA